MYVVTESLATTASLRLTQSYRCFLLILALGSCSNFELFRYTHHFHIAMVLAVLWHAPSAGYFLAGGMVMYGMQRIMQFRRVGIVQARLHIVRRHGSIGATELNFRTLNGGAIQHLPGQFVYLQIPCLSPLEWHPFSLCSTPSDSASTLLIANRGANSFERAGCFTDRLWQLAELLAASPPKQEHQVAICVDGPYGEGYDAHFVRTGGYNAVVLVAGGFGITPIISVFSALLEASEAGQLRGVDVDLIWCNPRPAFFAHTSFARIFALARNNERFSVSLFATQERLPAQGKLQYWNCHRPDWPTQLDSARRQAQAGSVLCLVSGPHEMADELSVVSLEAGFDFRAISFDI